MSHIVLVHRNGRATKHTDANRELWERRNARLHPDLVAKHKVKIIDCETEEEADEIIKEYQAKGKPKHAAQPKPKPRSGKNKSQQ